MITGPTSGARLSETTDALDARLLAHGVRPTRHRRELARLLLDGRDRHVTAEQVFQEAAAAGTGMVLATVYNTLHQLSEAGLLAERVLAPGRVIYDTNTSDHWHTLDEATGEVRDLPAGEVRGLPDDLDVTRVEVVVRVRGRRG